MSNKKSNIIFTIIISIIFLIATYLLSLVKAYTWFDLKWLSNDFLIVFFGGAFASSAIVLLSEIFSYFQQKRNTENQLYSNTIFLYTNAVVARNTLNSFIENPNRQITKNSIELQKNNMLSLVDIICCTDYITFSKKQKLFMELQSFKNNHYSYRQLIENIIFLDIAINDVKIQAKQPDLQVNASYDIVNQTIMEIKIDIETIIQACDNLIQTIDYSRRYHWEEKKEKTTHLNSIPLEGDVLKKYLTRKQKSEK